GSADETTRSPGGLPPRDSGPVAVASYPRGWLAPGSANHVRRAPPGSAAGADGWPDRPNPTPLRAGRPARRKSSARCDRGRHEPSVPDSVPGSVPGSPGTRGHSPRGVRALHRPQDQGSPDGAPPGPAPAAPARLGGRVNAPPAAPPT